MREAAEGKRNFIRLSRAEPPDSLSEIEAFSLVNLRCRSPAWCMIPADKQARAHAKREDRNWVADAADRPPRQRALGDSGRTPGNRARGSRRRRGRRPHPRRAADRRGRAALPARRARAPRPPRPDPGPGQPAHARVDDADARAGGRPAADDVAEGSRLADRGQARIIRIRIRRHAARLRPNSYTTARCSPAPRCCAEA